MGNRILAFFAGLFALLALGASIVIPYWILHLAADDLADLRMPLLALSGFLGVFACVALLVLAFKAMGLTVDNQALGMPEGSVRALIAIFLIVTLGMSALFLLGPARPVPTEKPGPPSQKAGSDGAATATATTSTGRSTVARAALPVPNPPGTTSPPAGSGGPTPPTDPPGGGSGSGNPPPKETPATATGASQEGDLAKQFLTLVGALVTTVVGFYFGSQTATNAAAKASSAMTTAMNAGSNRNLPPSVNPPAPAVPHSPVAPTAPAVPDAPVLAGAS